MIVCGAAAGVARALDEGLRYRMLGFLTRRTDDDVQLGEAVIDAARHQEALQEAQETLSRGTEVDSADQNRETRAQAREPQEHEAQDEADASDVIGAQPAHEAESQEAQQQRRKAAGS